MLTITDLYKAALEVSADVEKNFGLRFQFYLDEYNRLVVNLWDKNFESIFRSEVKDITENIYVGFALVEKVGGIAFGIYKARQEAAEAAKPEVEFDPEAEKVQPELDED